MSTTHLPNIDIMSLAERKMSYLQNRQSVLAGNVANANTPNYVPKDVSPFQGVLNTEHKAALKRTNPAHLAGNTGAFHTNRIGSRGSLDGNHVVLEDEMAKIADNSDQQRFASSVYGRYVSMMGMAVNGSGSGN